MVLGNISVNNKTPAPVVTFSVSNLLARSLMMLIEIEFAYVHL